MDWDIRLSQTGSGNVLGGVGQNIPSDAVKYIYNAQDGILTTEVWRHESQGDMDFGTGENILWSTLLEHWDPVFLLLTEWSQR